jgi:hypothetical protein
MERYRTIYHPAQARVMHEEPFTTNEEDTYQYIYTDDGQPGMRITHKGKPSPVVTLCDWPAWYGKEEA